jgi:hypothetical protein
MGEFMTNRSRKDRLKKKFSGIEMTLKNQDIKSTIAPEVIESSSPKNDVKQEMSKTQKEISYLDFILKICSSIYNVISFIFVILWTYLFRPLIKDAARVGQYILKLMESRPKPAAETEAIKSEDVLLEAQVAVGVTQNDVTAAATVENSSSHSGHEKFNLGTIEAIRPEHNETSTTKVVPAKILSTFEIDLNQIFQGQNIEIKLNGKAEDLEHSNRSLEFDSTLYEFINFRLDQTKLIQNINSITVNVTIDEKTISHAIDFDLKVSGQKWSYMFSRNTLSTLQRRIAGYQGKINCEHTFNSTMKREVCHLNIKHQRLDAFTTKEQVEESSAKNRRRSTKEETL